MKMVRKFINLLIFLPIVTTAQVSIPRVDMMPNFPQPYLMRDWQAVSEGYDSLVFDISLTDDYNYLPLVWINNSPINYPEHSSFGLHTVVGTPHTTNAEGINVLAALVSASLVGIDKSNQFGQNWVLGAEEFFNRRPAENVYLNNTVGQSGNDWWYDVMPNVFFYQLNDLYPGTGDFDFQFTSVADQWLRAVEVMGGSTTPWLKASMHYRAWQLSTMTPYSGNLSQYVEPEAAGAISWLLYNAYVQTGKEKYRIGAEWAMEFLNAVTSNPSYELMLPYGIYVAARMNAELGTTYDVEKLLNWNFDYTENIRNWGVVVGNWGDYSASGLVGEPGYAFAMNGYEMAGALVPMLRYDDRFAEAIGKWVLNMANASRLFYTAYLPDANQDYAWWAHEYDPNSVIAHESMLSTSGNASPFATGDAVKGGWGATNYALYGSSHVGILGGIIDTTNVPGILKLDLLITDYYHDTAYPTYLLYNPHDTSATVTIDVGTATVDVYDAITNLVLVTGASGSTSLTIAPTDAIMIVLTPSGGTETFALTNYLVDGVVVDYSSGQAVANYPPRFKSLDSDESALAYGQATTLYATAEDRDGDALEYVWTLGNSTLGTSGQSLIWTAPDSTQIFTIVVSVSDGVNTAITDSIMLSVTPSPPNNNPSIAELTARRFVLLRGESTTLSADASDPDGDILSYHWYSATADTLGTEISITWPGSQNIGTETLYCTIHDNRGGSDTDSLTVTILAASGANVGVPIATYPFSGGPADSSGLGNHGSASSPTLTPNKAGLGEAAYQFNGTTDFIRIPSNTYLNFREAITVSFEMKPSSLPNNRESYPISHGNWENRWKVSISPNRLLRWTIKSTDGIKDIDSQTAVNVGTWYHVAVTYDGQFMDLYINGKLETHAAFSGKILTTNIDLMIGQVLPGLPAYNFAGVLDQVHIYEYALTTQEIQRLAENVTAKVENDQAIPLEFALMQNYPNPFNPSTTFEYQLPSAGFVKLQIYDISGRLIDKLLSTHQPAGRYKIIWNSGLSASGIYFVRLQMDGLTQIRKVIKIK